MRSIAVEGAAMGVVVAVLIAWDCNAPHERGRLQWPRMANPEHLRILLTPEWNDWRARNVNVTPDLTGADLAGKDITGRDLKRADLTRADLSRATLAGT